MLTKSPALDLSFKFIILYNLLKKALCIHMLMCEHLSLYVQALLYLLTIPVP